MKSDNSVRVGLMIIASMVVFSRLLSAGAAVGPEKKIIEFGWDTPTTDWLVANISRADAVGFDGAVLTLSVRRGKYVSLAWHGWGKRRLKKDDFEHHVRNLKLLRSKAHRLTEIFLRFNVTPGNLDWYDDEFNCVLQNAEAVASIVRECGLRGILLDVEQYHGKPFHYGSQKYSQSKSFADYKMQVRMRGRQFIQAINKHCSDVVILLTFGYYIAHKDVSEHTPLSKTSYGLLPSFLDGMIEACTDRTVIVDGWEFSYGYKRMLAFEEACDIVKRRALKWTAVPERYRKVVQVGFGLWVDRGGRQRWDVKDFGNNYFNPEEFEYALHCALKVSDRYVWVYCHTPNWWTGKKLPKEYWRALRNARQTHPKPPAFRQPPKKSRLIISAKEYPGHGDRQTFGDLWTRFEEVGQVPRKWKFRLDAQNVGQREKWFATDFDDSQWKEIEIAEWWEPQGYIYDGFAWYRVWLKMPEVAERKRVFLFFGAVDESAWVYVNGRLVKAHNIGELGWKKRFAVELTGRVRPNAKFLVAVRVLDRVNYGGIWKSVKLLVEK